MKENEALHPRKPCQAPRLQGRQVVLFGSPIPVLFEETGLDEEDVGTAGKLHDPFGIPGTVNHIGDVDDFLARVILTIFPVSSPSGKNRSTILLPSPFHQTLKGLSSGSFRWMLSLSELIHAPPGSPISARAFFLTLTRRFSSRQKARQGTL